jgi:hypothetical protein
MPGLSSDNDKLQLKLSKHIHALFSQSFFNKILWFENGDSDLHFLEAENHLRKQDLRDLSWKLKELCKNQ